MKKLNSLLMSALMGGALMFAVTSCKDECKDVTCENGGTCNEGVCECPTGFSGELCEVEDLCITQEVECLNGGVCDNGECMCEDGFEGENCGTEFSAKFIGTYNGDDDCGFQYQSQITRVDENTVSISNFAGTNTTATADITESSKIIVNSQTNGGFTYSGSGSISGTTINIDYSLTSAGITENCSIEYTR